MLRASALGAIQASAPREGDILYVWEPFCHIGGAQMLLVPLLTEASLAIAEGFSASRFWAEVAEMGATHIHHLGGILQILLSRPSHALEREHQVRVSWGAGMTPHIWKEAESRFGLVVHECYGMTEMSSFITVNRQGPEFGIGYPLPWFEVRIVTEDDGDSVGEIQVRGLVPGLETPGYLNNTDAAKNPDDDGWWHTGDAGEMGADSQIFFRGRISDSFRVRGENVSSWQVEHVFAEHDCVEQCAVLGVPASSGEQELLLLVKAAAGRVIDIPSLVEWARERIPEFQVPRYLQIVSDLPMTASRRVAKREIIVDLEKVVDLRPNLAAN
jgi:crotonobetaine/carnitine-CoA ligase